MSLRTGTPVITVEQLKLGGVCKRWRDKLHRMFGPEIPVTLASCVEHAEDIDWDEATYLLSGEYRLTHVYRCNEILREHEQASAPAYERLKIATSLVSERLHRVRTEVYNLTSLLSDRRRANSMLTLAYDLAHRVARAELLIHAAASLMRYDIRLATAFCVAYTQQWTKECAT